MNGNSAFVLFLFINSILIQLSLRSGTIPRCLELSIANEIENNIDGQSDEHSFDANFESSKAIGIGIAVGAGALLILIIIVAVICLKA